MEVREMDGLKENREFRKVCPFKQNEDIFEIIMSRVNWLEQEIQKLEGRLRRAESVTDMHTPMGPPPILPKSQPPEIDWIPPDMTDRMIPPPRKKVRGSKESANK
jgi:hypothetical protein